MADFRFKQFSIKQDNCAMKVGTDGVLLGAWCNHPSPRNILDIGSGTGLIALMCAQRFPEALITAIEPDELAFLQALHNVNNSIFNQKITLTNTTLQQFTPASLFDLMVCNPPFYTEDTQAKGTRRQLARHASNLPLNTILAFATQHLTKDGSLCLILPYKTLEVLETNNHLNIQEVVLVKGTEQAPVKRVMVRLGKQIQVKTVPDTLVIEEKRHEYTNAYRALTKDFYLKF